MVFKYTNNWKNPAGTFSAHQFRSGFGYNKVFTVRVAMPKYPCTNITVLYLVKHLMTKSIGV
jgi:hypothetical protein